MVEVAALGVVALTLAGVSGVLLAGARLVEAAARLADAVARLSEVEGRQRASRHVTMDWPARSERR